MTKFQIKILQTNDWAPIRRQKRFFTTFFPLQTFLAKFRTIFYVTQSTWQFVYSCLKEELRKKKKKNKLLTLYTSPSNDIRLPQNRSSAGQ